MFDWCDDGVSFFNIDICELKNGSVIDKDISCYVDLIESLI